MRIKMSLFCIFIFFGMCFIGCVTTEKASQNGKIGLTTPFPDMVVGEGGTISFFNRVFHAQVIKVNNDGSFIVEVTDTKSGDIFHRHYNNEYQLTKEINIKINKLSDIADPPIQMLSFPLFLGKKWSDKYYGISLSGQKYQYMTDFNVKSMETINTKAGEFKAYKIFRSLHNITTGWKGHETYWYAPEAKMIVKSKPSWGTGLELLSFHPVELDTDPPAIRITSPSLENGQGVIEGHAVALQGQIEDASKINAFAINEVPVPLDEEGGFLFETKLEEGTNTFSMKAEDVHGNQAEVKITLLRPPLEAEPERVQPPKPIPITTQLSAPTIKSARWAVVIGVSEYQDYRIPSLRYASADARLFHEWLISPSGGRYAHSRVLLLTEKDATFSNIKKALYEWLSQALEEDIIVIYFAGHGSPDSPDSKENMFLLPYDADYESIATTGFPMWDIETALKRFIKAKRVIVIADACHAGGVGEAFDLARRTSRGISTVNPISEGFQNLSQVGEGVCIISASSVDQYSQESKDWGGGHGVFTYFLHRGLSGDADYDGDGKVSLGEIIPFLSENVRRATNNAQSPTVAGRFDPALYLGR